MFGPAGLPLRVLHLRHALVRQRRVRARGRGRGGADPGPGADERAWRRCGRPVPRPGSSVTSATARPSSARPSGSRGRTTGSTSWRRLPRDVPGAERAGAGPPGGRRDTAAEASRPWDADRHQGGDGEAVALLGARQPPRVEALIGRPPRARASEQGKRAVRRCHRAVTAVQQPSIMLTSESVARGRSRRSAGGARFPAAGWRPGGGGKPVELRAPGGIRRAGWLTVCHRTVRRSGCCSRDPVLSGAGIRSGRRPPR